MKTQEGQKEGKWNTRLEKERTEGEKGKRNDGTTQKSKKCMT